MVLDEVATATIGAPTQNSNATGVRPLTGFQPNRTRVSPPPGVSLLTRPLLLFTVANFFLSMVFYLLTPTMAVYARDAFGATPSQAGLASGIFILGAVAARLVAGKYLDVVGRRRMMLIWLSVQAVTCAAQIVAGCLPVFYLVRFASGMGYGAASTALSASVQGVIPPERRGEGTGIYALSFTLAPALGPLLGLTVAQRFGSTPLFLTSVSSAVIALLLAFFLTVPEVPLTQTQRANLKGFRLSSMIDRGALPLSLVILGAGACYAGCLSFLQGFADEAGLSTAAGFFFLIYAATALLTRPLSGRLVDRFGDNVVLYPCLLGLGFGMALLAGATQGWQIVGAGVLVAVGYGVPMSVMQAIVARQAPVHRVGLATSTYYMLLDIGLGLAPYELGAVQAASGYRSMYWLLVVVAVVTLLGYFLVHGRRHLLPNHEVVTLG